MSESEPASLSALNRQGRRLPSQPLLLPSSPPSRRPDKPLLSEGQPSAQPAATPGLTQTRVRLLLAQAPFPKMGLSSSVFDPIYVVSAPIPQPQSLPRSLQSVCTFS